MSWLWLISVGVSDLQIPVWTKVIDECGKITWKPKRYEIKSDVREVHEKLLILLKNDQITFEKAPIDFIDERNITGKPQLELDIDVKNNNFIASISHNNPKISDYRISETDDTIDSKLPLCCHKVEASLEKAKEI